MSLASSVEELVEELALSLVALQGLSDKLGILKNDNKTVVGAASEATSSSSMQASNTMNSRVAQEKFSVAALALDAMLGQGMVDKALEICRVRLKNGRHESAGICAFVARTSKRQCWHVRGGGRSYLCIERFCSCPSFALALETAAPICKHLLAVRLSQTLKTQKVCVIEDEEYSIQIIGSS